MPFRIWLPAYGPELDENIRFHHTVGSLSREMRVDGIVPEPACGGLGRRDTKVPPVLDFPDVGPPGGRAARPPAGPTVQMQRDAGMTHRPACRIPRRASHSSARL